MSMETTSLLNTSIPESTLKKKTQSIPDDFVWEGAAKDETRRSIYVNTYLNPADLLTTSPFRGGTMKVCRDDLASSAPNPFHGGLSLR
jgi:hypothetical protein